MLELRIGRVAAACFALGVSVVLATSGGAQTVYVEDSPAASELAERAAQWRAQGRLNEAVAALAELAETFPGKLMPVDDPTETGGRFLDATAWVRATLAADPALRAAYVRQAEPVAARELAAALAAGGDRPGRWYDAGALADVGRRYWSTPSGLEANLAWCGVMLERGRPGAARAKLLALRDHAALGEAEGEMEGDAELRARYADLLAAAESSLAARAAWLKQRAGNGPGGANVIMRASDVSLSDPVWTAWWDEMKRIARPAELTLATEAELADAAGGIQRVAVDFGNAQINRQLVVRGPVQNLLQPRADGRGMRPGTNLLGVQAGGTLTDDAVYVGDGRFVACVDRSSGRPRWVVGWPGQWLSTAARGQRIQDRRGVLVLSDTAVTVFGPAQAVRPRMRNAAAIDAVSQGVWCLDRTTGATRWRVFPEDLGEGFAGAQFVGEVVSAGPDVLAVGVRRVQNSGFVDAFIAGLDAGSGEVLWTRHLVSTAESGGAGTLPVVDPMVVSDGRLFVDDGLGVVACVDPDSGGLHWLRVLTTEPAAAGLADAPAELEPVGGDDQELVPAIRRALVNPSRVALRGRTGPALLPAGLLVAELAQAAADDAALLLDPATGQVRRRISADDAAWVRRARWFVPKSATTDTLATQGDSPSSLLVSAGPLWRIDGRDLSVVWRSERSGGDEAGDWPPAVDGSTVLHAMQGSLRRYSWATGEAGDGAGWAMGSRLLADRGEVFGVSAQGVNGMVSGRWGERRLRERIEDAATLRPRDAEPGLALAKLGVSLSRPELLLDGVTASLGALRPEARPDARSPDGAPLSTAEVDALLAEFGGDVARHPDLEQVVGESGGDAAASVVLELIERVAEAEALPPQVRRAAFDRVAAAVTGPEELVAYHLAMGPLEREAGRPAEAIEHFQAVLQDPLLAAQTPRIDGGRRQAGQEARKQLTAVIAESGFAPYAPFDALARTELERLRLESPRDASRFEWLAERFPLAIAASDALIQAGDLRAGSTNPRLAVLPYQRAYRAARSAEPRDRAAGRLAELYLALERPDMTRGWLRRVKQEFPAAAPWMERVPAPSSAWEELLATLPEVGRSLPSFDASASLFPWATQGTLIPVHPEAEPTLRRDLAVVRFRGELSVVDPSQRRVVVKTELPARDADLRRFSDDQLVLVSSQRASFILIDINRPDDEPITIPVEPALLAVPMPALDEQLQEFDAQLDAERMDLERLRALRQAQQQAQRMAQVRLQLAQRGGGFRFYGATETLLVAADTAGRVVAFDRFTGDLRWSFAQPRTTLTGMVARDDAVVLIGLSAPNTDAQQGITLVLDPLSGRPQGPAIYEAAGSPLDARPMPDGSLLVTYPTFVAAYAPPDHRVMWRSPRPFGMQANFLPPPVLGSAGDGVLAMRFPSAEPSLLLLDPDTGKQHRRLTLNAQLVRARRGLDVLAADGRVHVLLETPEAFTADGNLLWRSAVDDPAITPLHQSVARDQLIVISERAASSVAAANVVQPVVRPTHVLQSYERETGRLLATHPIEPGASALNARNTRLFDHAIGVQAGSRTIFLSDLP